jgi:hypothetical protein
MQQLNRKHDTSEMQYLDDLASMGGASIGGLARSSSTDQAIYKGDMDGLSRLGG